jgi:UDP-N-acetyl-D-galactosamine dehydrogenase
MYTELLQKKKKVSVTGLGYVGLPVALHFARSFSVIGYDKDKSKIEAFRKGIDPAREVSSENFTNRDIEFTCEPADLARAHFHIVAVPTPVDDHKVPNLRPLQDASKDIGVVLKRGDYVIFESTVYPGCTEEDCLPILEHESGLKVIRDFKLGYSPERISPGDRKRGFEKIVKIVAGCDDKSLEEIAKIYSNVVSAGVYRATSIRVAEAAKVIENTQRDLNISFVNELSIIFDRMGLDTSEVLEAAATKWNFMKFTPGLVGGHCISVDPYYLVHKSKQLGYDPQVILSGRRINDGMPSFIAKRLVQMLISTGKNPRDCRVLTMGITFKENVSDIRNSKVVDLVRELLNYSVNVDIVDPYAVNSEVSRMFGIELTTELRNDYDAIIVAVSHNPYKKLDIDYFRKLMIGDHPILLDLKGLYDREMDGLIYWRL